jgi:hypothetical protein
MIKIKLPSCLILVPRIVLVDFLKSLDLWSQAFRSEKMVEGFQAGENGWGLSGQRTSTCAIRVSRISHSGSLLYIIPQTFVSTIFWGKIHFQNFSQNNLSFKSISIYLTSGQFAPGITPCFCPLPVQYIPSLLGDIMWQIGPGVYLGWSVRIKWTKANWPCAWAVECRMEPCKSNWRVHAHIIGSLFNSFQISFNFSY